MFFVLMKKFSLLIAQMSIKRISKTEQEQKIIQRYSHKDKEKKYYNKIERRPERWKMKMIIIFNIVKCREIEIH